MFGSIGNYTFKDSALLKLALTHRSKHGENNERLEFLGDALLGAYVTEMLYRCKPTIPEGDLSRMRSSLVCTTALARVSRTLELDRLLLTAEQYSEVRSDSVLAGSFEAVLAAVYMDGGYAAAGLFVIDLFTRDVLNMPDAEDLKDSKTRLQEYLQSIGETPPDYYVASEDGPPHDRTFDIATVIDGKAFIGTGRTVREASQSCAERVLSSLL